MSAGWLRGDLALPTQTMTQLKKKRRCTSCSLLFDLSVSKVFFSFCPGWSGSPLCPFCYLPASMLFHVSVLLSCLSATLITFFFHPYSESRLPAMPRFDADCALSAGWDNAAAQTLYFESISTLITQPDSNLCAKAPIISRLRKL